MLKQGAQDLLSTMGDFACYALSLCKAAELAGNAGMDAADAVSCVEAGIQAGYIAKDMTVLDGAAFLRLITGLNWTKEYKEAGYKPRAGDYLIAEWFNKRTGKTHFTLEYPEKWNSLSNSITVKEGAISSYRLYRVKE